MDKSKQTFGQYLKGHDWFSLRFPRWIVFLYPLLYVLTNSEPNDLFDLVIFEPLVLSTLYFSYKKQKLRILIIWAIFFLGILMLQPGSERFSSLLASVDQQIQSSPIPSVFVPELTYQQKQTYILDEINAYRASRSLPPAQKDPKSCDFAKKRAAEIVTNFNHDGFWSLRSKEYGSVHRATENLARNFSYKDLIPAWEASPEHRPELMADTPYICVEWFYDLDTGIDYYAMEGWKS